MAAEEPKWVQIQQRTFTNWVNIQLAERQLHVDDLQTDFMDGVSLINLVELLSKGSVGKYNKRSSIQSGTETTAARQHARNAQANIDIALKYLTENQGIKIVNIGAGDFADGNLRIILGLVWTLILHYQIQEGSDKSFKDTKDELLAWVNSLIGPATAYGLNITNFKADWEDGKALAALVDAFSWRSFEDWDAASDSTARNTRAIETAQEKLKIPGILAPQDVGLDDLSLLCYLDFFWDVAKKRAPKVRAKGEGYGQRYVPGGGAGGAGGAGGDGSAGGAGGADGAGAGGAGGAGAGGAGWSGRSSTSFNNVRLTWH